MNERVCKMVFDECQLKTAKDEAWNNWRKWQGDFEHIHKSGENSGKFCEMPVLKSFPRFLGFVFDYSLARMIPRSEFEGLFKWYAGRDDPCTFSKLNNDFLSHLKDEPLQYEKDAKNKQKTFISLNSKLLGMWNPTKFAMWDRYARGGLVQLQRGKDNPKGRLGITFFNSHDCETYETYNNCFMEVSKALQDNSQVLLPEESDKMPKDKKYHEAFRNRILDSYLVLEGKEIEKAKKEKQTNG